MTQGQKQPPESPTDAAETAPSTAPAPFTARLFLTERPTRRERWQRRRWWHLTIGDWAIVAATLLLGGVGPHYLLRLAHDLPPTQQPLGESLATILATISGALVVYMLLRRALDDAVDVSGKLLHANREAIDTSRDLLSAVRGWVQEAYQIGQQEGRADYEDLLATADATQARVDELERQLADPRLADTARLTYLRGEIDRLQNSMANLNRQSEDLPAQMAELDRLIDAVHAEHEEIREQQERILQSRAKLDQMDEWILALLSKDPQPTDVQISKIVGLSASRVLQRRTKLAAAGYQTAQKRQGQRPSGRQVS